MNELFQIALQATKDILEKNLQIYHPIFQGKKVIFVYDDFSELSTLLSRAYRTNLEKYPYVQSILFDEKKGEEIKQLLLSLEEGSMVILVQTTNFRLENFRIRLLLQQRNIGCIEHNHLKYIKVGEYETYIRSLVYRGEYYKQISDMLKSTIEQATTLKIISSQGHVLKIDGGCEEMKQNTGNFALNARYATYPIGENFTEARNFLHVEGEILLKAYPGLDLQVNILAQPLSIQIKHSRLVADFHHFPGELQEIFKMISDAEGDIMMRELGFGLNPAITFEQKLSDVNAFERMLGFHISLGKKHNIYRNKLEKSQVQRFHIDIFPDVQEIWCDDTCIYREENYMLLK